jgi:hypothetical protein
LYSTYMRTTHALSLGALRNLLKIFIRFVQQRFVVKEKYRFLYFYDRFAEKKILHKKPNKRLNFLPYPCVHDGWDRQRENQAKI